MASDRPTISTHILDTGIGDPARPARPSGCGASGSTTGPRRSWSRRRPTRTAASATCSGPAALETGAYALEFDLGDDGFFTSLTVEVQVPDASRSYHVPLLVAPFGLSTYRGS